MESSLPSHVPGTSDDAGFQPERTGLAWNRTLVVLAATFGIMGVHAFRDGMHIALTVASGFLAALVLVLSSPLARSRSRRARELLVGATRSLSPTPLLALSVVVSALALASLALITIRG